MCPVCLPFLFPFHTAWCTQSLPVPYTLSFFYLPICPRLLRHLFNLANLQTRFETRHNGLSQSPFLPKPRTFLILCETPYFWSPLPSDTFTTTCVRPFGESQSPFWSRNIRLRIYPDFVNNSVRVCLVNHFYTLIISDELTCDGTTSAVFDISFMSFLGFLFHVLRWAIRRLSNNYHHLKTVCTFSTSARKHACRRLEEHSVDIVPPGPRPTQCLTMLLLHSDVGVDLLEPLTAKILTLFSIKTSSIPLA